MIDLRLNVTGSKRKRRTRGAVLRIRVEPFAEVLAEDAEQRGEREVARRTGKTRRSIRMWRGVRTTGNSRSAVNEFRGSSKGRKGGAVSNALKASTVEDQTGQKIFAITPDQEHSLEEAAAELAQQAVEAELPYESQRTGPRRLDKRARRIVRKHGPIR